MPDHRRKDADCPSPVAAAEGTAAGMSSEHHCPGSSPAGNYYSGEPAPDIAVALVNPDFENSDRDQAVATALAACSDRKGFLTCFTILCLR